MRRVLLFLAVVALFAFAGLSQRRIVAQTPGRAGAPEPWSGGARLTTLPGRLPALTDLERCVQRPSFMERIACYRPVLEAQLAARGPRAVLADLDGLQTTSLVFQGHCHDMAHVLGRYWIAGGGTVADGFREGSNVCHSGFYHGMVERVLRGDAVLTAEPIHASPEELTAAIVRVCTADALETESGNFRFQCLHGLGHAVVFSLGYRLPLALETCDALSTDWDRRSCWGGAFMENITGVERERRMLRDGDPHYPCSVVKEQYRDACYIMQTSRMVELGMSWDAIARACRAAGPHRLACFQSFGRDLSPRVRQEGPAASVARCAALEPDERLRCIQGAVFALADHTWDGRYAYPFCAAVTGELRLWCFREAHNHLRGLLEQPDQKLEADCGTYARASPACLSALSGAATL